MRASSVPIALLVISLFVVPTPAEEVTFDRFCAVIGPDDDTVGTACSIAFQVFLDGVPAYDSGTMRPGDAAKTVSIPLGNARQLQLIINDGGDSILSDRGNWADARLVDDDTGTIVFLSDLPWRRTSEWVTTRKDTNVLQSPIKLGGVVYPKGLGGFARMNLEWWDWNALYAKDHAIPSQLAQETLALLLHSRPKCALVTAIAAGGKAFAYPYLAKLPTQPSTAYPPQPVAVSADSFAINLRCLRDCSYGDLLDAAWIVIVQGVELRLNSIPAQVSVLDAAGYVTPAQVVLGGKPVIRSFRKGQTVELRWENWRAAIADRLRKPTPQGGDKNYKGLSVQVRCVVLPAESSEADFGSAIFRILGDGKELARSKIVTPGHSDTLSANLDAVRNLSLVTDDAGDGGYLDSALWQELIVPDVPLSNLRPDFAQAASGVPQQVSTPLGESRTPNHLPSFARGYSLAAPGEIVFLDLPQKIAEYKKSHGPSESLNAAEKQHFALSNSVLALQLADEAAESGHLQESLRLLDRAHNARDLVDCIQAGQLRAQAEVRIQALYERLHPTKGRLPLESGSPAKPPLWRSALLTKPPGEDRRQATFLTITASTQSSNTSVSWNCLVITRGLAVDATLARGDQIVRIRKKKNPLLTLPPLADNAATSRKANLPVKLFLRHDPAWDYCEGTLEMPVLVWKSGDVAASEISERWNYSINADGSCAVTCTISHPTAILIPQSAQDLSVSGAAWDLTSPISQYGSLLEPPYISCNLLLLYPHSPGTLASASFKWPDGYGNVPISLFDPQRTERGYFSSLPSIVGDPLVDSKTEKVRVKFQPRSGSGVLLATSPKARKTEGGYEADILPGRVLRLEVADRTLVTSYTKHQYRNLSLYAPQTPAYSHWLEEYLAALRPIYDALAEELAWEPDDARFILVPDACQIPGYAGATWGDYLDGKRVSETWIAVGSELGAHNQRHKRQSCAVRAHELHWVFMGGLIRDLPNWLAEMTNQYLEDVGRNSGAGPYFDEWPESLWYASGRAKLYLQALKSGAEAFIWRKELDVASLTDTQRLTRSACLLEIARELRARYGSDFWARFWTRQRANPRQYQMLTEEEKTNLALRELSEVARDSNGVAQLLAQWGLKHSMPDRR